MSPTSDDLRALLAERADSGPVTAPFDAGTGARLAGVRARIRQRRRARAAASALAVVLVAGSATAVTARLRHEVREPQPAQGVQLPLRDLQGRPLATRVQAKGRIPGTARFDAGWTDLHLALRCTGSPSDTTVVLLDGRAVAHTACGGPGGDVTVDADQARRWGLTSGATSTVSVLLVRTPPPGGVVRFGDHASDAAALATVGVYTSARLETGGYLPAFREDAILGGTSLPVTGSLGTRSVVVVPGGEFVHVGRFCQSTAGQAYTLVVTVEGRRSTFPCTADGDQTSSTPVPTRSGRPVKVTMEVTGHPDAGPDTPRLGETLPGAVVGVSVTGQPYLPDALQGPSLLSPPEVDAKGRPLLLSLVAGRDRSARASVRVPAGQKPDWRLWCMTEGGASLSLVMGEGRWSTDGCSGGGRGAAIGSGPSEVDGQFDVGLSLDDAGPKDGAVLALYGSGTVLQVVQQAGGVVDPAALVTTTPPAPSVDDGVTLDDRKSVRTAWLVARGGQRLDVDTLPGARYAFTMACAGTTAPVTALLIVDGVTVGGDQEGPRPCEGTVRGGEIRIEDSKRPRRVELVVVGPESALVTVGLYDLVVESP